MTTLADAPLRYVLTIVHLTPIKSIEKHLDAIQEAFRGAYPELDTAETQTISVNQGLDGVSVALAPEKVWQFANLDRSLAVTLGSDFLVLHCGSGYPGHAEFIRMTADAVSMLKAADGVRAANVKGFGYRYVDVVTPKKGDAMSQYLQGWAMPSSPPNAEALGLRTQQMGYNASFKVGQAEVRFRVSINPSAPMPPDLSSPFLKTNGWLPDIPNKDFAVVDFDAVRMFKAAIPLDVTETTTHLTALHRAARSLFDEAITPHAMHAWSSG